MQYETENKTAKFCEKFKLKASNKNEEKNKFLYVLFVQEFRHIYRSWNQKLLHFYSFFRNLLSCNF